MPIKLNFGMGVLSYAKFDYGRDRGVREPPNFNILSQMVYWRIFDPQG